MQLAESSAESEHWSGSPLAVHLAAQMGSSSGTRLVPRMEFHSDYLSAPLLVAPTDVMLD